jgi:hypothetical protein
MGRIGGDSFNTNFEHTSGSVGVVAGPKCSWESSVYSFCVATAILPGLLSVVGAVDPSGKVVI